MAFGRGGEPAGLVSSANLYFHLNKIEFLRSHLRAIPRMHSGGQRLLNGICHSERICSGLAGRERRIFFISIVPDSFVSRRDPL
jgi:hypothetical protein